MKRAIFTLLLILTAIFYTYGQNTSPIDLVLLLDTSSTMSSSYDNVNNYITGAFLNEFLRIGDTFHLIAFSSDPRFDCARRILGIGDVETIIGRMLIQYPVETGSNVSSVLTYAERYVSYLPQRPKKIVIITSGGTDTTNLVNASKQRLNSRNITLDYIQVTAGSPLSNLPRADRPAAISRTTTVSPSTTPSAAASRPSTETSSQTGAAGTTTGTSAATSAGATTSTSATTGTSATTSTSAATGSSATTSTSATTGTGSTATGTNATTTGTGATTSTATGTSSADRQESQEQVSTLGSDAFGQTQNTTPSAGGTSVSETDGSSTSASQVSVKEKKSISFASSFPVIIILIILVLLILGFVIFFASRKLRSSPNRVMADVASSDSKDKTKFVDHSKDLAKYAAVQGRRTTPYDDKPINSEKYVKPVINPSGPLLLNLFVEEQNTSIGKRNIHSLKSGYSFSVGGGKSDDYYIFLVPVPPHLGEIRRDGSTLSFIPKKPNCFPDIGSNTVKDCINKTIRIISERNYEIRFRFEMYEDPIIALNRMLMSVKIPG
jgi:hypothetical protein